MKTWVLESFRFDYEFWARALTCCRNCARANSKFRYEILSLPLFLQILAKITLIFNSCLSQQQVQSLKKILLSVLDLKDRHGEQFNTVRQEFLARKLEIKYEINTLFGLVCLYCQKGWFLSLKRSKDGVQRAEFKLFYKIKCSTKTERSWPFKLGKDNDGIIIDKLPSCKWFWNNQRGHFKRFY